ncbi:MAG TPA: hypothetical protein VJ827_07170 [Rubrobacter sp.]|nr:hypothetical protein [Rubrobacter sp.]
MDRENSLHSLSGERAKPPGSRGRARVCASDLCREGRRFLVRRRTYLRPFWLIARYRTGRMEVLRTILASGQEALPVFSFEDEARMFLDLGASGADWRARVTSSGELVSVLCGPCAEVDRVVLDPVPLPGPLIEGLNRLLSMEREAFIGSLLNQRRSRSPASGRGVVRRRAGVLVRTATPVRR